jgi:hypothetical protein
LRLSLRAFQIVSNVRAFTAAWSLLTCKATGERTSRSRELFLHRPYLHIGVLPRGGLLADEKKKIERLDYLREGDGGGKEVVAHAMLISS